MAMVVRSGYRAGTGRGWTSLRRAGPRTRCGAVGGSGRGCVLIKRTLRGGQVSFFVVLSRFVGRVGREQGIYGTTC